MEFPLNIEAIKKLIPHRYPFLLIDRILDFDGSEKIKGCKLISYSDAVFQGHFPNTPVFPGVLQIEALAQTSAVIAKLLDPEATDCYLTEITEARFKQPVEPGDTLYLDLQMTKKRNSFFWFEGKATVDNKVTATCSFSAKVF